MGMASQKICSLAQRRWWWGGLALGLALPAAAIVPALETFPVEEDLEVRVWTIQSLPEGWARWEGRVPGMDREYRLDVRCAPGAVKLSYTDPDGQEGVHYSVTKVGSSWTTAVSKDDASGVAVKDELQRLATQQHSRVCLPRVYPNAPRAPQT